VMDNTEMNRIIAEKVHGWHIATGSEMYPGFGCIEGDCWFDSDDNLRWSVYSCGEFPGEDDRVYSPATNIAQAFEAAETWRKVDKDHREWVLSSPSGPSRGWVKHPLKWEALFTEGNGDCEGHSDTDPAYAITEALVKAVSDEVSDDG